MYAGPMQTTDNQPPKEDLALTLQPHRERLRGVIQNAFLEWTSLPPEQLVDRSARTRASWIFDGMVKHARASFVGVPGVELRERRNMFFLEMDGKVLLRFKKLDRNRKVSNIPTAQQLRLLNQEFVQLELNGIPRKLIILNAGYQLNPLQTDIENLLVTLQEGRSVTWTYALPQDADGEAFSITVLPQAPLPPTPPRVRAKKDAVRGNTLPKTGSNGANGA
jgi:hypothetical protein